MADFKTVICKITCIFLVWRSILEFGVNSETLKGLVSNGKGVTLLCNKACKIEYVVKMFISYFQPWLIVFFISVPYRINGIMITLVITAVRTDVTK